MHPFRYTQALDETAARSIVLAEEQAVYIAGGTCLVDLMKLGVQPPHHLVDITALPLAAITLHEEGVRIGALARNSDVAHDALIRERYPAVAQALLAGASTQLRNMATIGGNLMQRRRCPYFRDIVSVCNKREPGTGCSALHGLNREHAILGGSEHCIATHPSDLCVTLAALDAVVQTRSEQGERSIPISDFYLLPEDHPERETALEPGELIVAVDLPPLPLAARSHYIKVRDRTSYAFALVSVAVALDVQEGNVQDVRIALGGVATKPWRAYEAEQMLRGQPAHTDSYQAAAARALEGAVPQRYNAFKIDLARRVIVYALSIVGGKSA
jgi:xanthine dehydrogenase YagS FAD-binding subunit